VPRKGVWVRIPPWSHKKKAPVLQQVSLALIYHGPSQETNIKLDYNRQTTQRKPITRLNDNFLIRFLIQRPNAIKILLKTILNLRWHPLKF
jgi:hypothetical protein